MPYIEEEITDPNEIAKLEGKAPKGRIIEEEITDPAEIAKLESTQGKFVDEEITDPAEIARLEAPSEPAGPNPAQIRQEVFGFVNKKERLSPSIQRGVADPSPGFGGEILETGKNILGRTAEAVGRGFELLGEKVGLGDANQSFQGLNDVLNHEDLIAADPERAYNEKAQTPITDAGELVKYFRSKGVTDGKQMMTLLKDSIKESKWDSTSDDKVRTLSDGSVVLNPSLYLSKDPEEGLKAIRSSTASNEQKDLAERAFPLVRAEAARALHKKLLTYDKGYQAHVNSNKGAAPEDTLFTWPGMDRGKIASSWDFVRDVTTQSGRNVMNTLVRTPALVLADVTGDEEDVARIGKDILESSKKGAFQQELAAARGQGGAVRGTATEFTTTALDMLPMLTAGKGGRMIAGGIESGAARQILGKVVSTGGVYGYSGLQGYSGMMQTALNALQEKAAAEGREPTAEEINTTVSATHGPATANALQTMILMKLNPGGSEALALGGRGASSVTAKEILTGLKAKYGESGWKAAIRELKPEITKFVKQGVGAAKEGFKDESIEEGSNQFIEGVITKLADVDPNKTWDDLGQETFKGTWMGGALGGSMSAAAQVFARPTPPPTPTEEASNALLTPEVSQTAPASAEAARETAPLGIPTDEELAQVDAEVAALSPQIPLSSGLDFTNGPVGNAPTGTPTPLPAQGMPTESLPAGQPPTELTTQEGAATPGGVATLPESGAQPVDTQTAIDQMRSLNESLPVVRGEDGEADKQASKALVAQKAKEAGMTVEEFAQARADSNNAAKQAFWDSLSDGDTISWTDPNGRKRTAIVEVSKRGAKSVYSPETGYDYSEVSTEFINNAGTLSVQKQTTPTPNAPITRNLAESDQQERVPTGEGGPTPEAGSGDSLVQGGTAQAEVGGGEVAGLPRETLKATFNLTDDQADATERMSRAFGLTPEQVLLEREMGRPVTPKEAAKEVARRAPVVEVPAAPEEEAPLPPDTSSVTQREGERETSAIPSATTAGKPLYRQSSVRDALPFVSSTTQTALEDKAVFTAESPELAIGQKGNTGLMLEFDSAKTPGKPNTKKPGTALAQQTGQPTEQVLRGYTQEQYRDSLTAVSYRPSDLKTLFDKRMMKTVEADLAARGMVRSEADGVVRWEKPATPPVKETAKPATRPEEPTTERFQSPPELDNSLPYENTNIERRDVAQPNDGGIRGGKADRAGEDGADGTQRGQDEAESTLPPTPLTDAEYNRHAELEARKDDLTPEELAEAQALVDRAALSSLGLKVTEGDPQYDETSTKSVHAIDKKGRVRAFIDLMPLPTGEFGIGQITVHASLRRKGVASRLFRLAQFSEPNLVAHSYDTTKAGASWLDGRKSADTFTGVPLRERFDAGSSDIRYQAPNAPAITLNPEWDTLTDEEKYDDLTNFIRTKNPQGVGAPDVLVGTGTRRIVLQRAERGQSRLSDLRELVRTGEPLETSAKIEGTTGARVVIGHAPILEALDAGDQLAAKTYLAEVVSEEIAHAAHLLAVKESLGGNATPAQVTKELRDTFDEAMQQMGKAEFEKAVMSSIRTYKGTQNPYAGMSFDEVLERMGDYARASALMEMARQHVQFRRGQKMTEEVRPAWVEKVRSWLGKTIEILKGYAVNPEQFGGRYADQIRRMEEILDDIEGAERFQRRPQGAKGSAQLLPDQRVLIKAFESADFTTITHEMMHAFEMTGYGDLTDEEVATLKKWAGSRTEGRTMMETKASEKLARGWEKYIATGKAPMASLQQLFDKMAAWMREVYTKIAGSDIDVDISPEVTAIFDKIAARMGDHTPAEQKADTLEKWLSAIGKIESSSQKLRDYNKLVIDGREPKDRHVYSTINRPPSQIALGRGRAYDDIGILVTDTPLSVEDQFSLQVFPIDKDTVTSTAKELFAAGMELENNGKTYLVTPSTTSGSLRVTEIDGKGPTGHIHLDNRWFVDDLRKHLVGARVFPPTTIPKPAARMENPSVVYSPSGVTMQTEDGSPLPPVVENPEDISTPDEAAGYIRGIMERQTELPPVAPEPPTPEDWNPDNLYSLQERRALEEAEQYGLAREWKQARRSFEALWEKAISLPEGSGTNLLNRLAMEGNPDRVLSDWEVAQLTHEGLRRKIAVQKSLEALNTMIGSKDKDLVEAAEKAYDEALAGYQALHNVAAAARTASGRALNAWKYALAEDFSVGVLYTRSLARFNAAMVRAGLDPVSSLPAAEKRAIEEYAAKQAATQKELADAQAELEATEALPEAEREAYKARIAEQDALIETLIAERKAASKRTAVQDTTRRLVVNRVRKAAAEARARLAAANAIAPESTERFQAPSADNDPRWYDRVLVMAEPLIVEPTMSAARFADLVRQKFGQAFVAVADSLRKDTEDHIRATEEDLTGVHHATPAEVLETLDPEIELTRQDVMDLARAHVFDGARNFEVMDRVFSDLSTVYPDLTKDQVTQLFTQYGEQPPVNTSEEAVALRKAKSLELIQKQIDDLERRGQMMKTGRQKDAIDLDLRAKRKERDDLAKAIGYVPRDPKTGLSSAESAAEKRMLNEIEELEAAVAAGRPRVHVREGVEYTTSMEELREKLADARAIHTEVFGREGKPEDRAKLILRGIDRRIEKERKLINAGLITGGTTPAPSIDSADISARREYLKRLKEWKYSFYDAAHPNERALEQATKDAQAALARRQAILEKGLTETPARRARGEGVTPDENLTSLWEAIDAADVLIREIRRNRPLTPAQQQAALDRAYDAAVATRESLNARVEAGDISVAPKTQKQVELRTRLIREENAMLRKALVTLQKEAGVGPFSKEAREARRVAGLEQRIADLRRRRTAQDYAKKPRTEPVTSDHIRELEARIYVEKIMFEQERAKYAFSQLPKSQRNMSKFMAVYQGRQIFNLGGDLGFWGRQGGRLRTMIYAHDAKEVMRILKDRDIPWGEKKDAAKETTIIGNLLSKGMQSFMNKEGADRSFHRLLTHPEYAARKKRGFFLVNPHDSSHELNAEGQVRINPMELLSNKVIAAAMFLKGIIKTTAAVTVALKTGAPVWNAAGKAALESLMAAGVAVGGIEWVRRVERAQTTMINEMRWMIQDMAEEMGNPIDPTDEQESLEQITQAVMTMTGKAAGKDKASSFIRNNAYTLGLVLQFPQYVYTNFLSAFGVPLYKPIAQSVSASIKNRKLVLTKAAQATATMYAHATLGRAMRIAMWAMLLGVWDEEDEESTFGVVLNPRNPNFGKVKMGKTYIDFSPGESSWWVRIAKMMTDTKLNPDLLREGVELEEPNTSMDKAAVLGQFMYNMLNVNIRTPLEFTVFEKFRKGGDLNQMDVFNRSDLFLDEIMMNLTARDIANIYEEHDPLRATVISGLLMTGQNVTIRENLDEKAKRELEEQKRYTEPLKR